MNADMEISKNQWRSTGGIVEEGGVAMDLLNTCTKQNLNHTISYYN